MNYKIISEFIKDISFEIPSLESFALLEKEISKYNVNFDIKSTPFKNNMVEVNTILRLVPRREEKSEDFDKSFARSCPSMTTLRAVW